MKLESSAGGSWFKFDQIGKKITGAFLEYVPNVEGKFGIEHNLFLDVDGKRTCVRCSASLARIMEENKAKIPLGGILTITYTGNAKTKNGGTVKQYDVDLQPGKPPEFGGGSTTPKDEIPF